MMNRRLAHERRIHCSTQYLARLPQRVWQEDRDTTAAEGAGRAWAKSFGVPDLL